MSEVIIVMMFIVIGGIAALIYRFYDQDRYKYQTASFDAFNRLKVSQPFTLGDYKHYYSRTDDMLIETTTGGTVTHNTNEASIKLYVTSTVGSKAIHQSKMYHHYMPGKSQFILSSFVFFKHTDGIIKRTGYFDDRDGIFLEQDKDGTLYFVIRSYTTGAVKETKVAQNKWNGDRLKTWKINLDKTQLLWIDFQWLGVGRVRCGFVHDDEYILCHTFYNSDNLETVYMANSNLPTRCEIVNHSSSSAAFMNQICSTVASEGGYSEAGNDFSYVYDITANELTEGAEVDLIGLKLQNTFQGKPNRTFARLSDVKVFSNGNNVIFKVYKVKSFDNGTVETLVNYDGIAQVVRNPTGLDDKVLIGSGIVASGGKGGKQFSTSSSDAGSKAKKNFIAQNFDSDDSEGYVISVVLTINDTVTDSDIVVSLDWREIY